MKSELIKFINQTNFPCIMAKTVSRIGYLKTLTLQDIESEKNIIQFQKNIYQFIDHYHSCPDTLHSFVLIIENAEYYSFERFEEKFWNFLITINHLDKVLHLHDDRVDADPQSDNFSFSLMEEAFFILALHPRSPRWSRQFSFPAIVFNPHQQFENLRTNGLFIKIRDIIRKKDQLLQGFTNPMLSDFGDKSEVYQYTGRAHTFAEDLPLFSQRFL